MASKAGELDRHWRWVDCLQQAMTTSLENVMAAGDMDLFQKTIHQLAAVPELKEASLTDFKGHIAYTTVPGRLHAELPAEIEPQLLAGANLIKRQTNSAFEIYKPLIAEKNCVSCHVERRQGDVIGVLTLSFSDAAMVQAQKNWDRFGTEFSRANATTSIVTIFVLIAILTISVSLCVRHLMGRPLERLAGEMAEQSAQVRSAADQFSGTSQSMAEGSSELAASIEETGSALAEMASHTKRNASHASKSRELARTTHAAAMDGVRQMETLNSKISEMSASANSITKVNHLIHEIAFQTNLLALNAAVEAARAGEAGMGFAVVAEEVRHLAQRSAAAAKETAAKVEGATACASQGVDIGREVAVMLNQIADKAGEVEKLAVEVAVASDEQTAGIAQINQAVVQMNTVTQNNAASAEETASAAQELNAQAASMTLTVRNLSQLVKGTEPAQSEIKTQPVKLLKTHASKPVTAKAQVEEPEKEAPPTPRF